MMPKAESGYTILEAMIFITISSSMFVLAMISFSGRQQQVQFTQAVRELDAKILDTINDVTTGYFPNDGSLQCSIDAAQPRPVIAAATVQNGQGTNDDCVMVGKAVQFYPDDGIGSTDDRSSIYTYNIVGKRLGSSGDATQSLEEAKPVTTSPTAAAGFNDTTEKAELKFGLKVTKVATEELSSKESGVIGFFTRFTRTFSTTQFSEGQTVSSTLIPGVSESLPHTQYAAANAINLVTDLTPPLGSDIYVDTTSRTPIIICLADTDMKRRASITIGGTGQASTRVDFDTYNRTICGG
jgi:type II secretory pathway pseudopilin PulG